MTESGLHSERLEYPANALPEMTAQVNCPACHGDISRLPTSAVYCPRCGSDLQRPLESNGIAVKAPPDLPVRAAIDEAAQPRPVIPLEHVRSPIVRGFASALYRLGRRYEGGIGSLYNRKEAERYYFKAAKLGNSAAMARLGVPVQRASAQTDSDSPPTV